MTKVEYDKCVSLMYDAIRNAKISEIDYAEYEGLLKEGKKIDAECILRAADQRNGYADGINQALVSIGFKHEDMKILSDLLLL